MKVPALCLCVPLTSKGKKASDDVLGHLTLLHTQFPATTEVFLAVDNNDPLLALHDERWFQSRIKLTCHLMLVEPQSPAPIVQWYNAMLRDALPRTHLEYFVLWGDDIKIPNVPQQTWFDHVPQTFARYHSETGLPFGFGCVAFNDQSSPGFPTFPVVHRLHVEMFGGFCPDDFCNQDADPWVFQLYRRWGVASIEPALLICNEIGGALGEPRYQRQHVNWQNDLLDQSIAKAKKYLETVACTKADYTMPATLDVVVPTFRTDMEKLTRMLDMAVPAACSVFFIIVVDNPATRQRAALHELESRYLGKVRVRFQRENSGASLARNRGLNESAAEWVLLLDDDVVVADTLLCTYLQKIHEHGDTAAGFVGNSQFPPPATPRQAAFLMSYLAYFWDVSTRMDHPPWGVTANLLVKRTSARFHEDFVKTGGGEDIALCLDTVATTGLDLYAAPRATILHPWWAEGNFSPWRFFNWTQGDGLLIDKYPQLAYKNLPNVVELSIVCSAMLLFSVFFRHQLPVGPLLWLIWLWMVEFTCDVLHLLLNDPNTASSFTGRSCFLRLQCALIATLFKNCVELGHFWVQAKRGKLGNLCTRFDWFCGLRAGVRTSERAKALARGLLFCLPLVVAHDAMWCAALATVLLGIFVVVDRTC